jgi:hypothetical protein
MEEKEARDFNRNRHLHPKYIDSRNSSNLGLNKNIKPIGENIMKCSSVNKWEGKREYIPLDTDILQNCKIISYLGRKVYSMNGKQGLRLRIYSNYRKRYVGRYIGIDGYYYFHFKKRNKVFRDEFLCWSKLHEQLND